MTSFFTDLHTILFLTYVTNAVLSSLLAWSGRNFHGAWLWVLAQSLLATGTVSDALPPEVPSWIPLILGNGAYVASCLVYSHSVWVFRFRSPFPRWLYILVPLQILSFCYALDQTYIVRAQIFSSWMTVGSLTTGGLLLWRVERKDRLPNSLTALPFLFLGIFSLVRVIHLRILVSQGAFFSVAEINIAYVTGAVLLSTITLFGYFMMAASRAEYVVHRMGEEITQQNEELIEAGRVKDLFFAIVAHDLRGPIGGAARYVRKHLFGKMTGLESKFAEVEVLAASLEKTNDFLEKLLWWSRSQLKDWTPQKVEISMESLLEPCLSLVHSSADLKGIPIHLLPPPYPRPRGDIQSVQLILGNLLSNAVKFSFPGKPILIAMEAISGACRITVEDHGVGMDQATVDRLFRIENKLSTAGTCDEIGSGLGLILARSLAERNEGRITIESTPGVGTKAHLWLPLANPHPSAHSE